MVKNGSTGPGSFGGAGGNTAGVLTSSSEVSADMLYKHRSYFGRTMVTFQYEPLIFSKTMTFWKGNALSFKRRIVQVQ